MAENKSGINSSVLNLLGLRSNDQIIAVKENGLADANFILTNVIKHVFTENSRLCLFIMHNTLGHYHHVCKKLGFDLLKQIQDGRAVMIEPLKTLAESLDAFLMSENEAIVKQLFLDINARVKELIKENRGRVYLIIDDVSHLLDLGIDLKNAMAFVDYCASLANDSVCVVINCHVSNSSDAILANSSFYSADLSVDVSSLTTGVSHDVTGVITIKRSTAAKESVYHYKAYDREIRAFSPGESLYYFGK